MLARVDHLAIPVSDRERSRRFHETRSDFGARPARRHPDGVGVVGWWDEPGCVSVRFRDPDGYAVEASSEPFA
jgi:catechol 2,3-dioxygenase-like lactoylglutathione lyase family enzyme